MISQRREQIREPISDCEVHVSSWQWTKKAKVLDISEGGMKIDIEESADLYEEVTLNMICEDGRKLSRDAIVIWLIDKVTPQKGAFIGLKFL